jgi:cellulose synthase/poly-beta-1,6-N-acetylglucosamine synthase-like glycosyltransferase
MPSRSQRLVTIVVVAHNDWPDVELAIQSALHQSYEPVEVIVVDNDSSDATAREVPARFGDRVTYCRRPNRFEGGGRNTGFELASGEFIQFLDADDFLAPNKIEKQVAAFEADPDADIVYGDFRVFASPGVGLGDEDGTNREYDDFLWALVAPEGKGAGLLPQSVLFRRRAVERVGPWDETIPTSDQDYWLRAAASGCRFRYCPGSLCFYQRRPGQMTARPLSILRDMEATGAKALGYIHDEPYRELLATRLARTRFVLALADSSGRRDAFSQLRLARATSPETISRLALVSGFAVAALPGGLWLARAPSVRPVRSAAARLLRLDEASGQTPRHD